MRRLLGIVFLLAVLLAGVAWWSSAPTAASPERHQAVAALDGDAEAGALVFYAGGCASCHQADSSAEDGLPVLAGGHRLDSDFGTFVVPNISSDPEHGIGAWDLTAFVDAMVAGVSPGGRHYYPAFPYTAYARVSDQDLADLWAFLQTTPASDQASAPNELSFPFSIRRGIGLWKLLYATDEWASAAPSDTLARGRYLVEALGHCAECHTPRDEFGGLDLARWMGGAPNPSGRGRIPNITPAALTWSAEDISYYLESGFTPDFDSVGGSMVSVVRNLAKLPPEDRDAIAAYLKGLAPVVPQE